MPAVTVSDITVLPRVTDAPNSRARRVKSITTAPQGFEGEGFPVRRAFAGVDLAELDPFIHPYGLCLTTPTTSKASSNASPFTPKRQAIP